MTKPMPVSPSALGRTGEADAAGDRPRTDPRQGRVGSPGIWESGDRTRSHYRDVMGRTREVQLLFAQNLGTGGTNRTHLVPAALDAGRAGPPLRAAVVTARRPPAARPGPPGPATWRPRRTSGTAPTR